MIADAELNLMMCFGGQHAPMREARVDHRQAKNGVIGEVTGKVRELYWNATRGNPRSYLKWLTAVYRPWMTREQDAIPLEDMHGG
jgi:hypothetical protein